MMSKEDNIWIAVCLFPQTSQFDSLICVNNN